MPTVRLTWTDPNSGAAQEDSIRVYRATAPFTVSTLPSVFATLAANTLVYDDTTALTGVTYFYAVGMVKGPFMEVAFVNIAVGGAVVGLDPGLSRPQLNIAVGNLSFSSQLTNGLFGARTKYSRRTGKHYFEVTISNVSKGTAQITTSVGIARPDLTFEAIGDLAFGVWVNLRSTANGNIWIEGIDTGVNLGVAANGDRYGFAIDLDAGLVWVRRNNGNWNNSGAANPATGSGGLAIGDMSGRDVGPTSVVTFLNESHAYRFKATSFVDIAPSGFGEWPITVTGTNSGLGAAVLTSVKNSNMALSGGNLTATRTGGSPASARSKDHKGFGRFYVEFTPNSWAGSGDCVGFAPPFATTNDIVSLGRFGIYLYRNGGAIWNADVNTGVALGTIATGERIDAAIDLFQRLVWFRKGGGNWNSSAVANPATGAGGISFTYRGLSPCIGLGNTGSLATHNVTANFGASVFGGVVPDGFVGGWPVQGIDGAADVMWVGRIGA